MGRGGYDPPVGAAHHHPRTDEATFRAGTIRVGERRRLALVMLLTGTTMVAEFIGGWWTGSMALLADAFHMLTHLLAVGISYAAIWIALLPTPPEKTYRNWRAEILGALFSAMTLIPIALFVIYEAVDRYLHPRPIEVTGMLIVASIGLAVNLVSALSLHHHSKENLNVRGAFLHMVADSASSVGVLAAGGILLVRPDFLWFDPLAAGLISVLILFWAWGLLRKSCGVLLEAAPAHVDLPRLMADLRKVDGVSDVHDVHVWTITSQMYALTAHVRLDRNVPLSETEEVGHRIQHLLDETYHINHATLQFEYSPQGSPHCEHPHDPAAAPVHPHA